MRKILVLLVTSFLFQGVAAAETKWNLREGEPVTGELTAFDFEKKVAVIEDETGTKTELPTADLKYAERKRILFSGAFHRSLPTGWSMEKSNMLIFAVFVPAILFLLGLWIAGMIFARKFNPFKAVFAFFGGWVIAVALMWCYFTFASKSPGNEKWILIAGALVSTIAVSVLISAIYRCKIVSGFYIFVSQFLFGILLFIGLQIWLEKKADPEWLEVNAEDYVFRPVGIVENQNKDGEEEM